MLQGKEKKGPLWIDINLIFLNTEFLFCFVFNFFPGVSGWGRGGEGMMRERDAIFSEGEWEGWGEWGDSGAEILHI